MTMFHMSNDSHRFRTQEELEDQEFRREGTIFRAPPKTPAGPGA